MSVMRTKGRFKVIITRDSDRQAIIEVLRGTPRGRSLVIDSHESTVRQIRRLAFDMGREISIIAGAGESYLLFRNNTPPTAWDFQ